MSFPLYFAAWPGQAAPEGRYAACGYCVGALGRLECPPEAEHRPELLVFHDSRLPEPDKLDELAQALVRETVRTGAEGIVCDWEQMPPEQAAQLIARLDEGLPEQAQLVLPAAYGQARSLLWHYDPARQTFSELLDQVRTSGKPGWLELEPVHLLLPLPLPEHFDGSCHPGELEALRRRQGAAGFYSEELCCNYFSFQQNGVIYLGLYDTPQSLRQRLELAETCFSAALGLEQELLPLLPGQMPAAG